MRIKVSIVEDHDPYRAHLLALVGGTDGFICLGAHATGEAALKHVPQEKPDVVLLDLELPKRSGLDCLVDLKARLPASEIVILTIHDDPRLIYRALEAGASGYLVKPVAPVTILGAIAEVHAGGSPMSSQIARLVVKAFRHLGVSRKELENLTKREAEILAWLARGYQAKEIGETLKISERTVRSHLHNVYEKLHVRSRTEAVAKYLRP